MEFLQNHWVEISVVYLLTYSFLKGIRDAFDKTPLTDDNWYERLVSAMGKAATLFTTGKRPDAK